MLQGCVLLCNITVQLCELVHPIHTFLMLKSNTLGAVHILSFSSAWTVDIEPTPIVLNLPPRVIGFTKEHSHPLVKHTRVGRPGLCGIASSIQLEPVDWRMLLFSDYFISELGIVSTNTLPQFIGK